MQEFVVKRKQINVKISETVSHVLTVPAVGKMQIYTKEITAAKPVEVIEIIKKIFDECGLPLQVINAELDSEMIYQLWNVFNGGKN